MEITKATENYSQAIKRIIKEESQKRIEMETVPLSQKLCDYIYKFDNINIRKVLAQITGDQVNERNGEGAVAIHVACAINI